MRSVEIYGAKLRHVRRERYARESAHEHARRIGVSETHLIRIELGKSHTTFELLDKLIPLYGVDTVVDLIRDEADRDVFARPYRVLQRAVS